MNQPYITMTHPWYWFFILIKKFKYVDKIKLNNYRTWEEWVIQVNKGDCLRRNIMIGNIYRPPNELVDGYTEFIDEFLSLF